MAFSSPVTPWNCSPGYYNDGSDCDCGCGSVDPDCSSDTGIAGVCDYCDDPGSCSTAACPGTIDTADNSSCVAAAVCGNHTVETGEACDGSIPAGTDCTTIGAGFTGGTLACSATTCQYDTSGCTGGTPTCAAGQTERVYVYPAASLPVAVPDNTAAGVLLPIAITDPGLVASLRVVFGATHTYDADLDVFLISPAAVSTDLSSDNGSGGDNYTGTVFDDAATVAITAGTAPFTGSFRPEQALSRFAGTPLAGTWTLKAADDSGTDTGSVTAFELHFCVAPVPVCGDGTLGLGEQCDGNNLNGKTCVTQGFVGGTLGCNACQLDTTGCTDCPSGQTERRYTATGLPVAIPDATSAGVLVPISVTDTGTVASLKVQFGATHTYDGDLDVALTSPAALAVNLSTGNGAGGDNYTDTLFDDAATTAITAGTAPFTGSFRPEQSLSTFVGAAVQGTWSLKVVDTASGDTGSVQKLTLRFCLTPATAGCGNGTIDAGESCDGTNLGGATCASATGGARPGGTLACNACAYDTTGCIAVPTCGNGTLEAGEACDGANFGTATCSSATGGARPNGTLACNACALDATGCTAASTCGNGTLDSGEACDGTNFGTATCSSATGGARPGGTLACNACALDTSGCTTAARADLALFTFETSLPVSAGPFPAESGSKASSSTIRGFHAVTATYSTPGGNSSAHSFNANNWSVGDYFEVMVPGTGASSFEVSFDQYKSSTGPADFKVQWSTDGTNFQDLGASYAVITTTWTTFGPYALPASADGAASIYVRLTSNVTTAASGTCRVDNVRVTGL
ncbi:MAG: proprotein convertase P-domain-containing protein [Myxococcales bacterium]